MKWGVVVIALAAAPLLADDVYLRGGGKITGEIVERTEDSVTVDIGGGRMTVRTSSVVRIEQNVSPIQEYRSLVANTPSGDAEAWRELARWATSRALATQAGEAYARVVEILPDDPEANRALGRVQYGGKWVAEEESYRARGYVYFEGDWMQPAERQTILAERRQLEEADRRAEAARMQAEEQAERAREAKEAAETEDFMHGRLPQYDAVVSWGWGTGPSLWPQTPAERSQSGDSR